MVAGSIEIEDVVNKSHFEQGILTEGEGELSTVDLLALASPGPNLKKTFYGCNLRMFVIS